MNLKEYSEAEEKKQHQESHSVVKAKSENETAIFPSELLKAIYNEPLPYYERQKQSTIKINNTFNDLRLFENKLIAFSGVPGSAKSRITLNIIQEIIEANSNYNAILFSLELNRNTAVSLLAKTPVHIKHNIKQETADKYNNMNQEYKENYIDNQRIGIIDRTTEFKDKINDIETIKQILEYYKNQYYSNTETKTINTFEDWKAYQESTEKEQKLIIFLDYFDILRTDKETSKTEYEKQEYLINELKSFRDNYNFVTFIIINSTNKEAFKTDGGNMGSIKGNSSIIFGYDQAFNIENIGHNRLKKELQKGTTNNTKENKHHRHLKTLNKFGTIDYISSELTPPRVYDKDNIYEDEGVIIIEDTKSRYGGEGTHFYKALNGYSEFITLPINKTDQENKQDKTKIDNKGKVANIWIT